MAMEPAYYLWKGDLLTAKEIARQEGIPVNTVNGFFSQCRGDVECVRQRMESRALRLAKREGGCSYPYLDGSTKPLAEILALHPYLSRWKIESRLATFAGRLDGEALAAVYADEPFDHQTSGARQLDAEVGDLGPRKSLRDVAGPSPLESKYVK